MNLRKLLLIIGLILAPLSGGGVFYLYHIQTMTVPVYVIKSNLNHPIAPGTLITSDMLEKKDIMQKDLPADPVLAISGNIYASKYLYPSDPLLTSKTTTDAIAFKSVNDRVVSIKPADPGLLGIIQQDDRVTVITQAVTFYNCRVVGTADSQGNIVSIIPQLARTATNNDLINLKGNENKSPDHVLIQVTKDTADILGKMGKDVNVIFESRPTLPDLQY